MTHEQALEAIHATLQATPGPVSIAVVDDPPVSSIGNGNVVTNPRQSVDVNNDGYVTPLDALLVSDAATRDAPSRGSSCRSTP